MLCKYCQVRIREEVVGDESVWIDETEGDACEDWYGAPCGHRPEPDELSDNTPEYVGLFDQGEKWEVDPNVRRLTLHGRKNWDDWALLVDWDVRPPEEFVGEHIYKALKRFDRMTRPWAPTRTAAPVPGRVLDNGATVLLTRSLPYDPEGTTAPGCIVLCCFRSEYVTWFFNEQDLGCHHGSYHGEDLQAALLNFLERS